MMKTDRSEIPQGGKLYPLLLVLGIWFLGIGSWNFLCAQPGSIDPSFNPTDIGFGYGDGANSTVKTNSIQSDGKIIIGGYFSSFNGTSINRIARLYADGSHDTSFNPGTGVNNDVKGNIEWANAGFTRLFGFTL